MENVNLKNMNLKKIGGSYMFLIPKAFIETGLIDNSKKYTLTLRENALDGFLSHVACEV